MIGALSLVIVVWLGTSMNCSRTSTFTGRSMIGIRKRSPGARTSASFVLPSRKTTIFSYCCTTRTDRYRSNRARKRTATRTANRTAISTRALLSSCAIRWPSRTRPGKRTASTRPAGRPRPRAPRASGRPSSLRAVHSSPTACTVPSGLISVETTPGFAGDAQAAHEHGARAHPAGPVGGHARSAHRRPRSGRPSRRSPAARPRPRARSARRSCRTACPLRPRRRRRRRSRAGRDW